MSRTACDVPSMEGVKAREDSLTQAVRNIVQANGAKQDAIVAGMALSARLLQIACLLRMDEDRAVELQFLWRQAMSGVKLGGQVRPGRLGECVRGGPGPARDVEPARARVRVVGGLDVERGRGGGGYGGKAQGDATRVGFIQRVDAALQAGLLEETD